MIIPTHTAIGLGCSVCGQVDTYRLSLFLFGSRHSLSVVCNCGASLFGLDTRNRKWFWLSLTCPFCTKPHVYALTRRQIWHPTALPLLCPVTDQPIAILGPEEKVMQGLPGKSRVQNPGEGQVNPVRLTVNPTINQVLDQIKRMVDQDRLHCGCGRMDLEVEILPDKIHLYCERCGAGNELEVYSTTVPEELASLEQLQLTHANFVPDTGGRGGRPFQIRNKRNV
ncbi:MAG: hypothetical protein GX295_10460 [Syntrophomonadaceae bacterium]|nr:hypothetical protein [Syntrophomonadaceae bacterium]